MPITASPLRYPGGKAAYADLLRGIIKRNSLDGCEYAEPFAGGAGAAIDLLLAGDVRANRSGILAANPIGGLSQNGVDKIDARFKKDKLAAKIVAISSRRGYISISNDDAIAFITRLNQTRRTILVYFDPPYYQKGELLYLNHYHHQDHVDLAAKIKICPQPWLLSYDNNPKIVDLYSGNRIYEHNLSYSLYRRKTGKELLIRFPLRLSPTPIRRQYHPCHCQRKWPVFAVVAA